MFTDEQIKAIEFCEGPCLVLGTPGSGKTTVIVNRINNLIYSHGINPENILVITFTRAAAESMKRRFLDISSLEDTRVRFGTFHSFFYWILRTAYGDNLKVLEETLKRRVIRDILVRIDKENYDSEELVTSVINQFGRMSCDMIDIKDYHSRDMADNDFRRLYDEYSDYKKKNGLIDFDDMVVQCYRLLSSRSDILDRIRYMYPYIMIDEFQDTNLIQYQIIKLLAHPLDNIYAVGDDDQSIYGFRGARPDIMFHLAKEFKDTRIIHLSENFRCPEDIVSFSDKLISRNKKRYDKKLISSTGSKGKIYIAEPQDELHELDMVVRNIQSAHNDGVDYNDIAVLYRTNLGPGRLIYKLEEYNIPFRVKDNIPDIYEYPVIRTVLAYIRFALGDRRRTVFLDFMNKPVRYISRSMLPDEIVDLDKLLEQSKDKDYLYRNISRMISELGTIGKLKPYTAINYIRSTVGYDAYLRTVADERNIDYDEYMDSLNTFHEMARECDTFDKLFDMIEANKKMLDRIRCELDDRTNRVQLMTLHSAKGLEYKEVHILDVVDGMIPHKKSKTPSELEEERRMFYVGVTRSSDRLYLYIPEKSGDKEYIPSRFVRDVIGGKNK